MISVDSLQAVRLSADWDHFHILLEQILHRVPSLGDATVDQLINSPETFSPDCKWIMGEVPEVSSLIFLH